MTLPSLSGSHPPRWFPVIALAVLMLIATGIYVGVEWAICAWGGR